MNSLTRDKLMTKTVKRIVDLEPLIHELVMLIDCDISVNNESYKHVENVDTLACILAQMDSDLDTLRMLIGD